MTTRQRTIAAAPVRSPAETWTVIEQLLISTLAKASDLKSDEVAAELQALRSLGPMLVAGGHLERGAILLVAAAVELSINTVAGVAALDLEENLNAVPGAAEATTWAVYLPKAEPLGHWIANTINGHAHLHLAGTSKARASSDGSDTSDAVVVDLAAFGRRKEGA